MEAREQETSDEWKEAQERKKAAKMDAFLKAGARWINDTKGGADVDGRLRGSRGEGKVFGVQLARALGCHLIEGAYYLARTHL